MLIGFVGLIGSGKDTAADYLVQHFGFKRDSFANTLKDAVSSIFGWDRELIEGRTKEAREWREQVDTWWANRLNIPNLTPRWVLQQWGTEVCRIGFHDDIWIASLENRVRTTDANIVISDVRFPNEIAAIKNAGGLVVRIKRGEDPLWFQHAEVVNKGPTGNPQWNESKIYLDATGVHTSESSWVGANIDRVVLNNGSMLELFDSVKGLVESHQIAK